ncbi:hypothetical protein BDV97DRAFT_373924 [Delphinella strobiligena]|nr:hypothetical protein BDV97DRAFT_373924 [Delphinella strobiligena]
MNSSTDTEDMKQKHGTRIKQSTKVEGYESPEQVNRDDTGIANTSGAHEKETTLSRDEDKMGPAAIPVTASLASSISSTSTTDPTRKTNKRKASRSPSSDEEERTPSSCPEGDKAACSSDSTLSGNDDDSDSDSEIDKPPSPPIRLRKKGRFKSPLSDSGDKEREEERQRARAKDERVFDRDERDEETLEEWRERMSRIPALHRF